MQFSKRLIAALSCALLFQAGLPLRAGAEGSKFTFPGPLPLPNNLQNVEYIRIVNLPPGVPLVSTLSLTVPQSSGNLSITRPTPPTTPAATAMPSPAPVQAMMTPGVTPVQIPAVINSVIGSPQLTNLNLAGVNVAELAMNLRRRPKFAGLNMEPGVRPELDVDHIALFEGNYVNGEGRRSRQDACAPREGQEEQAGSLRPQEGQEEQAGSLRPQRGQED